MPHSLLRPNPYLQESCLLSPFSVYELKNRGKFHSSPTSRHSLFLTWREASFSCTGTPNYRLINTRANIFKFVFLKLGPWIHIWTPKELSGCFWDAELTSEWELWVLGTSEEQGYSRRCLSTDGGSEPQMIKIHGVIPVYAIWGSNHHHHDWKHGLSIFILYPSIPQCNWNKK